MREILFRGKRLQGGNWVEGYFFKSDINKRERESGKATLIFTPDCDTFITVPECHNSFMVVSDTVGQYTGLKDKNGKRIFEGDIVAQNWYDYDEPRDDSFGKVVFCEYDCSFSVMDVNKDGFMPLGRCGSYHWEVEVIGNIHDNPELLKGGEG